MSVTAQNFRNFTFALYNVQPTETLDQMLGALQNRHEPRITDAFINTLRVNGYPNFGNLGGQGNWFRYQKIWLERALVLLHSLAMREQQCIQIP